MLMHLLTVSENMNYLDVIDVCIKSLNFFAVRLLEINPLLSVTVAKMFHKYAKLEIKELIRIVTC